MAQTDSFGMSQGSKPRSRKRGTWPALGLFFVAPLVAEFLLGNLPIKMLPALIVLAPLYGGGALLTRELVRRVGRGWPSILILGLAYAIFEEAFTTQSLFNPDYLSLKLCLLTPAFIPAFGIGGWWTLWMFNVHVLWSIATPIALIEATVPDRASKPWLGRIGLCVTAIVFLFGAVVTTKIGYKLDHYMASIRQFSSAAAAVLLLGILAFQIPLGNKPKSPGSRPAPSPWLPGVFALATGSAMLLTPKAWGWGAVAVLLTLDLIVLALVLFWSQRSGWGLQHKLALASGAALAYGWHAFVEHPSVGQLDSSVRAGNVVFLAGAVALILFAARRTVEAVRTGILPA